MCLYIFGIFCRIHVIKKVSIICMICKIDKSVQIHKRKVFAFEGTLGLREFLMIIDYVYNINIV